MKREREQRRKRDSLYNINHSAEVCYLSRSTLFLLLVLQTLHK